MTVIDAGSAPRTDLMLTALGGDEQNARLQLDSTVNLTSEGEKPPNPRKVPSTSFALDTTITGVAGGEISAEFEYSDVEADAGDLDPIIARQLERSLNGIDGITGSLVLNERGALLESRFVTPEDIDPVVNQTLEQVEGQIAALTVPFPNEPVGVGAQWSAQIKFDLLGLPATGEQTYTLRKIEDDSYAIDFTQTQTVEPGFVEDNQGKLIEGETSGSGTIEGSLDFPLPKRSESTSSGAFDFEVEQPNGDISTFTQSLELDVTLAPDM